MMINLLDFRVWNGFEMVHDVMIGRFGVFYANPENNGLNPEDSTSLTPYNTKYPDNTPVMQFIGRKDSNDVKIYSDDIVTHPDYVGNLIVKFHNIWPQATFGLFDGGGHNILDDFDNVVVIGNVHANPELISESYNETNP